MTIELFLVCESYKVLFFRRKERQDKIHFSLQRFSEYSLILNNKPPVDI